MSAKLTPHASTRILTSPASGSESGASFTSRTSGGPAFVIQICRMTVTSAFECTRSQARARKSYWASGCSRNRSPASHPAARAASGQATTPPSRAMNPRASCSPPQEPRHTGQKIAPRGAEVWGWNGGEERPVHSQQRTYLATAQTTAECQSTKSLRDSPLRGGSAASAVTGGRELR